MTKRTLAVTPGNNYDVCPLCGIHRENAGFLKETCGPHYLKPRCFIYERPDPARVSYQEVEAC